MLILCCLLDVYFLISVARQPDEVKYSIFHLTDEKTGTGRLDNFPMFAQLSNGRSHTCTQVSVNSKLMLFSTNLEHFLAHNGSFALECFLFSWPDSFLLTTLNHTLVWLPHFNHNGQSIIFSLKKQR